MEISRRTDYALRMLASLVLDPEGVVSVRTAAKESEDKRSYFLPAKRAAPATPHMTTARTEETVKAHSAE